MQPAQKTASLEIRGALREGYETILSPAALDFIAGLHQKFDQRRRALLAARVERQAKFDAGQKPDFLKETAAIRAGDWRVAPLPADLRDRRVEITGPVTRKMVINALNSGARVFMADFEDATTPGWDNLIDGQINLRDAIARKIDFTDPDSGKAYKLADKPAVLKVRPRGWHLDEAHVTIDGQPISGSLFDFGLFFFHNAKPLLAAGSGPYFYLPKLESHFEARLWNDVFLHAQAALGLPAGSIRATVLIETITAAFEIEEILHELKEHSSGVNCGRWDYIFSFIKKFRADPACLLPDRAQVTMKSHFMHSYSLLAIQTCHKRGAPAIGGMSAFIPIRGDAAANDKAMEAVRADKEREAGDGHDGTWVAHPGLVATATEIFDRHMPAPNQIERQRGDVKITANDLLKVPAGSITRAGLAGNVAVGIGYIEAWLRGQGCVPLFNLMEDAATAEISRTQLWQWRKHGARLEDGGAVTVELIDQVIAQELAAWKERLGPDLYAQGRHEDAAKMMREMVVSDDFAEFLTLPAYDRIVAEGM